MDPITQGVLGVTAAQLTATRQQKIAAAVLGFFSGMAADLDVLIRSSNDPLLYLEYHRHFTHSLIFIPFGALVCALFFRWVFRTWFARDGLSFSRIYLFCFAGYASHALLDACTTYGTQLFWPFSSTRFAWNNVSVIDPLFTLPLIAFITAAVWRRSSKLAVLASAYVVAYLSLGLLQNSRALQAAEQLASSRGHQPINLAVKPSFANLMVWKSVYEHAGSYYVDAVRVLATPKVYPGGATAKLNLSHHFDWLDLSSQQAEDVERFRWFSNDHLGIDPRNPQRIIDIRYSLVPNRFDGMWGISLDKKASPLAHVSFNSVRPESAEMDQSIAELWQMIRGLEVLPRSK
ncbi:MAG: inner membrane protein [Cryomorphaceae bacterium]|jgi:inner membrane protein